MEEIEMGFRSKKIEQPLIHPKDMAIDLGTATGLIWSDGEFGQITIKDILKGERTPVKHVRTLIARERKTGELSKTERNERINKERVQALAKIYAGESDSGEEDVVAVGQEAFDKLGRAPYLDFDRAVKRGNISSIPAYRAVMRYLIRMKYGTFRKTFQGETVLPRILVGVPRHATHHHLKTVQSIIEDNIGARAFPVWEQIAAAIGAKLPGGKTIPFRNPKSCAILDLGGGSLDIAVLADGDVVDQESYDTAGDDMDAAIMAHMGSEHNLDIGFRTAISIKEGIGSAFPQDQFDDEELHEVNGASFETQMPGKALVTRKEIRACLEPVLQQNVADIKEYLRTLLKYGEVHADIFETGFYLTGGQSLLPGLAQYLQKETSLKIQQVENALTSVIDGLILMLADEELLNLGLAKLAA